MRLLQTSSLFVLWSGLVSVVAGQAMPACALQCLQTSLAAQNKCGPTDVACICTDVPLGTAIQTCVLKSCRIIDALAAKNATETMCGGKVRDITTITPVISGVSGGLATIAVIIRVWTSILGAGFWLDDAMCVIALVFALPMAILEFIMSSLGFGKDLWTLTPSQIYRIVQFTWLTEIFWMASVGCVKLAFLFLYLRVFPNQKLRKVIHGLIGFGIINVILMTVIITLTCLPISYIWTSWDGEHVGKCINLNSFVWAHAVVDIVFDCVIFAIPVPELIKLKLSVKKRVMLIGMFSVGGMGTIVSILRLQALMSFATSTNPTYDNTPTAYWSVLACFVGIFCACMPSFRRFLSMLFPRYFTNTEKDSNNYSNTPPTRLSSFTGKARSRSRSALDSFGGITKTVVTDLTVVPVEEEEHVLVKPAASGPATPSHWSAEEDTDKGNVRVQVSHAS